MKPIILFSVAGILIVAITGFLVLDLQSNYAYYDLDEPNYVFEQSVIHLDKNNPIKVGILHSLSGTISISESSVVDSTLLAIEEINDRGGILGREIIPIVSDGNSNWNTFALEAENLIVEEKVSVVFGGWTSASRKTMKPIFEEYDHLLFYPVQYEGLESSKNIIYTGASPNQQVLPTVKWAYKNLGTSFFLVGSDYIFPKSVNEIIKEEIKILDGIVVGEEYKILGEKNFKDVIDKIIESKPDVILNTINGDSNIGFFNELRQRGITSDLIPTISFSIAENEIKLLGAKNVEGDYAAWNYFQSLDTERNEHFVQKFQEKYGIHRVVNDPMEAGYIGVYLYARAVESAGTDNISAVRDALKGMTFHAPEGTVGIDPQNNHLSKVVRIGQILSDGQFKIVSSSEKPIKPEPYPTYKTKQQWNSFLDKLYYEWNENWANLGV